MNAIISFPVMQGNIFSTANISHATHSSNVLITIVFPGSMCVMAREIALLAWMNLFLTVEVGLESVQTFTGAEKHLFIFQEKPVCIHLRDLCDQEYDCPHHDDELFCDLQKFNPICPVQCECLIYAVRCHGRLSISNLQMVYRYQAVYIYHNQMQIMPLEKNTANHISVLKIKYSKLAHFCKNIMKLKFLIQIDVSHNEIFQINKSCFSNFQNLRSIKLNDNKINHIENYAFENMRTLFLLNASRNKLLCIDTKIFGNIPNITILSLSMRFILC